MNIETVRSLTDVLNSVRSIIASGHNITDVRKLKYALMSIQDTEQDLRNPIFVEASKKLYESLDKAPSTTTDKPAEKPCAVVELKKPDVVQPVMKVAPKNEPEAPPAKFQPKSSGDLSVAKGGLTGK